LFLEKRKNRLWEGKARANASKWPHKSIYSTKIQTEGGEEQRRDKEGQEEERRTERRTGREQTRTC